jgi:hypothetical protein
MKKTLVISESQKKLILLESINDEFSKKIKDSYNFVEKIIKMTSEQMSINFEFLLTWGATIGGFVGPLNDFVANRHPEISDVELSLIITGVIAIYYVDNKETVNKIIDRIKEKGLYKPFSSAVDKSIELKSTFLDFMGSLNITLHKVTNIMAYAFVIPIIPMLYELTANGSVSTRDAKEIALRLVTYGTLTVSGIVLRELITKIIKRFKGKY